ncbi:HAD family phosphatase [candidate division KSB1 bacterium]|nr:HAD family phosphatase [candidate division KSB1 bacterium]
MNIVFDLGGVVFHWNPKQIIEDVFEDLEIQEKIMAEVFRHDDWILLDKGLLDNNDAIHRAAARTGASPADISRLMNNVPHALIPNEETLALIKHIKSHNEHKLYVLSNMHTASINHLERQYSCWDLFDGQVYSCRVRMAKPELGIYQYLLKSYNLNPQETVFIDDMQENLTAAANVGIQTIQFINPQQCERNLSKFFS